MTPITTPAYTWDVLVQKLGLGAIQAKPSSNPKPCLGSTNAGASLEELMQRQCVDGERTQHLTTLIGTLLAARVPEDQARQRCHEWNEQNIAPLDEKKVDVTFYSIQTTDQRNHPERYPALQVRQPLFELSAGRIDRYLHTNPAPRRWLLKDLIVLGKVGAVVAPGGSSKSQWLLQLAIGVASGLSVAGHWQIGEPGSVLAFFAEDDDDEIHRRIKRIVEHLTFEGHGSQLAGIEERFYAYSTIGRDMLLTRRDHSGEVSATPTGQDIIELAAQIDDLKLIIIDPASRFRGGEENSNEDATRFVEALETLAKNTGATILIAHHTNKGSYGSDGQPGQGASRGASALTDGLRWQMNLAPPSNKQAARIGTSGENGSRHVVATVTKTNYSAFPVPVILERLDNGYLVAVNHAQAQQRAETAAIMSVIQVLMQQPKPISARTLEDRFGGVSGPLKMPKHEVRNIVKIALDRGALAGAERKPLSVTALGQLMAQSAHVQTEIASQPPTKLPRKKNQ